MHHYKRKHNILSPSLRGMSPQVTGGVSYPKNYTPSTANAVPLPQGERQGVRAFIAMTVEVRLLYAFIDTFILHFLVSGLETI